VNATKQSPRTPIKPEDLNAPFFSPLEAAWLLKCSYDTVLRAIWSGRLGASQDEKGGAIRISREDLDAYYAKTRIGPPIRRTSPRRSARAAA
jgi:excisionase family DNA binding protein